MGWIDGIRGEQTLADAKGNLVQARALSAEDNAKLFLIFWATQIWVAHFFPKISDVAVVGAVLREFYGR